MSKSDKATLHELQQPEKLQNALARSQIDDCLGCRLVGKP